MYFHAVHVVVTLKIMGIKGSIVICFLTLDSTYLKLSKVHLFLSYLLSGVNFENVNHTIKR